MAKRPTSSSSGTVKATQDAGPLTDEAQPGAPSRRPRAGGAPRRKATAASRTETMEPTQMEPRGMEGSAAEPAASTPGGRSPRKARTAPPEATAGKAKPARKKKPSGKAGKGSTPPKASRSRDTQPPPRYLAAELGQPVDPEGEPIGAASTMARSDSSLQEYTLQLWRQMQSGRVVHRYAQAIERAGLTVDEIWAVGITETRTTSSTPDEMRRYRQKMLFRANLLEAILAETVADLHRLDGIEPTPPKTAKASS